MRAGQGNLHPRVIVALVVLLFVARPVLRKLEGVKDPVDPLLGTWGGTVSFSETDTPFWEGLPGPHQEAAIYFTLSDHGAYGYAGPGQIAFNGEHRLQPIEVWGLRSDSDGKLELHLKLPRTLDLASSGKLQSGTMNWQSELADHPFMTATLHHGTEPQYQKLLAEYQTLSRK